MHKKNKKEAETNNEDVSSEEEEEKKMPLDLKKNVDNSLRTPFERWEKSLMACTSFSQVSSWVGEDALCRGMATRHWIERKKRFIDTLTLMSSGPWLPSVRCQLKGGLFFFFTPWQFPLQGEV